jgi:integrase
VAVVVAFDAALRISEAAALSIGDVLEVARADARLAGARAPQLVLALRGAKTAADEAEQQSVYILGDGVTRVLREWTAYRRSTGAQNNHPLFGRTKAQLAKAFCREANRLGANTRFTWHSLRHGCATTLFMAGWSTTEVMRHGRWRSASSAWHYQQSGRAAIAAHGASDAAVREGERIAAELGSTLARPSAAQEI